MVEDRFEATTLVTCRWDRVMFRRSVMRGVVSGVTKAGRVDRTGKMTVAFDQVTIRGRAYPTRATVTQAIESEGIRARRADRRRRGCWRDHRRHPRGIKALWPDPHRAAHDCGDRGQDVELPPERPARADSIPGCRFVERQAGRPAGFRAASICQACIASRAAAMVASRRAGCARLTGTILRIATAAGTRRARACLGRTCVVLGVGARADA